MKKIISVIFAFVFSLLFFKSALAAQFFFYPDKGDIITGQQFDVSVKIKTDGEETLNAAQGKINFDKDRLEVVSITKEKSVFNLWIQDPSYSSGKGTIEFIGGITGGISGASLQVIKISFKAKSEGLAELSFNKDESQIAANDGLGTNILSQVSGAAFKISPVPPVPEVKPGVPTPPPPPPPPPPIEQVTPPVQIVRPVIPAKKLPKKPELEIALYPDPTKWYNKVSPFLVKWELPEDIIGITTEIDNNSASTLKSSKSEGLFDAKIFPPLNDGLNFLHVQFKNTQGWGEIAHYRLAIDMMPPFAFEVTVKEGAITDNPQPTLTFMASDQLSGIDYYRIKIPNHDPVITASTSYQLPLLEPGKYRISVKAYDKAGNSSENITEMNILPIAPPEILFFNKDVFIGMESLAVKGTSLPNSKILIYIKKLTGETIFAAANPVNDQGFWEAALTPSLKGDTYYIEVRAQDARGALSLPVKSTFIKVREKPVFILGTVEITAKMFLGGMLAILFFGFAAGILFFRIKTREQQQRISNKIVITERDLFSAFARISDSVEKCLKAFQDQKITASEASDLQLYLKRLEENIKKMKKYLADEIEEIDD